MNEFTFFRTFVLVMAVLALLTATVLDGVAMRYIMRPIVRRMDDATGGSAAYPPGMRFLLEHAWVRRLYHAVFAALMFVLWWFLGTPTGIAILRTGH